MYVISLDNGKFLYHSNDIKDFLEIVNEYCERPEYKDTYKDIEHFVINATLGETLYLSNKRGKICVVDADELYRKYQLNWMIEHGFSINDLILSLYDYSKEFTNHPVSLRNSIEYIFKDWENDNGFNGELWACRWEWEDNELYELCDM